MGEPGSPIPPPAGGFGRAQPSRREVGKPRFPTPSPPGGPGPHAGGWGNRVSPSPHPVGGFGRAQPSRRGVGKPRFPTPSPPGGPGPHAGGWGNPLSPRPHPREGEGAALVQEDGETGFPHAPARGWAWPKRGESSGQHAPRPRPRVGLALTQEDGETGFPHALAPGWAWPSRRRMGKPPFPTPPPLSGPGPYAGGWGNPVSPRPRPRVGLGGLRPPNKNLWSSRRGAARAARAANMNIGWERGHLARGEATRAGRPRSRACGWPQVRPVVMVFEQLLRSSPRRRASPRIAEGFSPTASPTYWMNFSKTISPTASPAYQMNMCPSV